MFGASTSVSLHFLLGPHASGCVQGWVNSSPSFLCVVHQSVSENGQPCWNLVGMTFFSSAHHKK